MKSSAKKVELASVDDLFSTEESRADAQRERVMEIPLSELHPFKNHPFKVKDDEAMMETADSVRQYGVLVPAIARPDPEGGYELVAGHRRHRASELAEKETMPVIVRDLDDDAATIIMVDSNLQRESLLPSERAFAYKMKLEAMKHQGERMDLTCSQVSYAVCQYFGIQTGENSFGYIASWSKDKELRELRASLETINKTSCELINDIERNYKEICKERGIDLTAAPQPEQTPPQAAEEVPQPSAEYQEALLVLDDTTYLHVQPCDTGWDYTLYDVATMKQLDGGQLDGANMGRSEAIGHVCEDLGMGSKFIKYAPLSMIETLYEQASQQTAEAAAAQLPDAMELALDEYPMPDPALTQDDLEKCGYLDGDLLLLSKERAYELMERDLTVYIVQEGENPEMAFDTADLDVHDGVFAVSREEWEESPEFAALVKDRMNHQEEREQAFLSHKGDCFAIYQVKHTDELRDIHYEGLEWLQSIGRTVQRENYELVYTAPLLPADLKGDTTEQLFYRFNNEHPADYGHPSMSVSDIVAIKRDGKVSCHYCDSFGFEQVPGFLPDNPLKNAEIAVEDDYGMIDGIINNGPKEPTVAHLEQQARSGQPISLMDLAAAAHREDREKKKSVMEQLKSQPKAEHKKTAPKKSAEREI